MNTCGNISPIFIFQKIQTELYKKKLPLGRLTLSFFPLKFEDISLLNLKVFPPSLFTLHYLLIPDFCHSVVYNFKM